MVTGKDGRVRNICLTMHQPWASLLVQGIKRVEGRSWSTEHRGHLWIHAAAREPTAAELRSTEEKYRSLYAAEGVDHVDFPRCYPTSCLLGSVEIIGCLSQAEFHISKDISDVMKLESESEFMFLCKDPRQLVLPFSLSGQHKLWKLDKHTREAAENGLGGVVQGPSSSVSRKES